MKDENNDVVVIVVIVIILIFGMTVLYFSKTNEKNNNTIGDNIKTEEKYDDDSILDEKNDNTNDELEQDQIEENVKVELSLPEGAVKLDESDLTKTLYDKIVSFKFFNNIFKLNKTGIINMSDLPDELLFSKVVDNLEESRYQVINCNDYKIEELFAQREIEHVHYGSAYCGSGDKYSLYDEATGKFINENPNIEATTYLVPEPLIIEGFRNTFDGNLYERKTDYLHSSYSANYHFNDKLQGYVITGAFSGGMGVPYNEYYLGVYELNNETIVSVHYFVADTEHIIYDYAFVKKNDKYLLKYINVKEL